MKTLIQKSLLVGTCSSFVVALVLLSMSPRAEATVVITSDFVTFLNLEKPTGEFDEPSLSGFEYLISSRTGEFRENDQYLIAGEDTTEPASLTSNLGNGADLSGTAWDFSIQHNLIGGRNFTFTMDDSMGTSSVLCWGDNCSPGSTSAQTINGQAPITQYNGLQIQVRAQVPGASSTVSNLVLTGVDIDPASDALFDEIVTQATLSTIPGDDPGRIGQWLLGDDLDFTANEWELSGTVTLTRGDAAIEDLTKVRLAVDFVNDMRLGLEPVPVPAAVWLFGSALIGLVAIGRKR